MPRHYAPRAPNPELPITTRYYDVGEADSLYVSGADLLAQYDHERDLYLLLSALRRGETGEYRGARIVRVW